MNSETLEQWHIIINEIDWEWNAPKEFIPTYMDLLLVGRECRKLEKFTYAHWCLDAALGWLETEYINHKLFNSETYTEDEEGSFSSVINIDEVKGEIAQLKSGVLSAKANVYICEGVSGKPFDEYVDCMNKAIALCDSAIEIWEQNTEAAYNKGIALSNIEHAKKQSGNNEDVPF